MSILAKILEVKRSEIALARRTHPEEALELAAQTAPPPRGMARALKRPPGAPMRAIAEIKRASPSAGKIRPGADPAAIACEYADAGAAAISVLTDVEFFDGQLAFLGRVRAVVDRPVLRKDFLIDPYQVIEARAAGADAVLLIAAALDEYALMTMIAETSRLGMDALVEVHGIGELERALACGATLVGVNHRNLVDFTIDMTLTARLRRRVPPDVVLVAESGIRSAADVRAMAAAGADAILVGESLMRAKSPGAALAALLAAAPSR
jgi:indole-3-glycerol phosphate synthase